MTHYLTLAEKPVVVRVGDRLGFPGFRTTLWGEVIKITPLYYQVRWTARRSGKTRVRRVPKREALYVARADAAAPAAP